MISKIQSNTPLVIHRNLNRIVDKKGSKVWVCEGQIFTFCICKHKAIGWNIFYAMGTPNSAQDITFDTSWGAMNLNATLLRVTSANLSNPIAVTGAVTPDGAVSDTFSCSNSGINTGNNIFNNISTANEDSLYISSTTIFTNSTLISPTINSTDLDMVSSQSSNYNATYISSIILSKDKNSINDQISTDIDLNTSFNFNNIAIEIKALD